MTPQNSTPRYLLRGNENLYPHKDFYKDVCSSFIYNSPELETKFTNKRTDKQVYMYLSIHPSILTLYIYI